MINKWLIGLKEYKKFGNMLNKIKRLLLSRIFSPSRARSVGGAHLERRVCMLGNRQLCESPMPTLQAQTAK